MINIGIPSKGRLKKDVLRLFKKNKLNIFSEKGERDLFGYIKKHKNIKVIYLHARECIEQLSLGNIDIGFSGYDLLKENEINIQKKILTTKKYNFGNANLVISFHGMITSIAAIQNTNVLDLFNCEINKELFVLFGNPGVSFPLEHKSLDQLS